MSDSNLSNIGLVNLPPIPKSIDTAVGNLTDKPTASIGATLADIWFLVFGGLSQNAEKKRLKYAQDINEFRIKLESKASNIPNDKKVDPDIRIVGPALEGIKYAVGSEELREMFSNLITASMNIDTSESVHPSFVEIVKQLSPLEAKILKYISNHSDMLPVCRICKQIDNSISDSTPMHTYLAGENFFKESSSGTIALHNYSYVKFDSESPKMFSSCLDNLGRLGLLDINYDSWFTDENHYKPFLHDAFLINTINQPPFKDPSGYYVNAAIKGICRTTSLGNLFIDICIHD